MRKKNMRNSLRKENNEDKKTEPVGLNKVRKKRENNIVKAEAYTNSDGERKNVVNMVSQFDHNHSNNKTFPIDIRKYKK